MDKLKGLLSNRQVPTSKPSPASKVWQTKPQPLPLDQERHPHQPCGPKCWLKGFLEYPEWAPMATLPHSTGTTPATDEQRLQVAKQLYSPLWAWQTRVIELHPGGPPDRLRCDLIVVDLIATPGVGVTSTGETIEYEALSYSWGYPAFTHQVVCNGIEVPVTEAMAQALLHLRLPDRSRCLWIDCFCINQFDIKEKTRQVQNMLLIYQKSTGVVAWLGVPNANDNVTLQYLHKIATSDTPIRNEEHTYHDEDCARRYAEVSNDLRNFYSRPWFARTWIRQEIFASKSLTLLCGNYTWITGIFRSIDVWQQFQPRTTPESTLCLRQIPNQDTLETMRQSRITTKRWLSSRTELPAPARRLVDTGVWLEGLLAGVRFGVTDSRDKIYGIIGMLEEKSRLLDLEAPHSEDTQGRPTFTTTINYAKSEIEVYQDITKFLINRDRNLFPLCIFRDRTVAAEHLPSWVIDCGSAIRSWYVATNLTAISEHILQLHEYFMQGSYGEAERVGSDVNGTMKLSGYRICTLESIQSRKENPLNSRIEDSLVTSPPIPDRGFFHTFIRDYEMLMNECAYEELALVWVQSRLPGVDLQSALDVPTRPRSALVSKAAGPAAFLVLADGCPLPLVLQEVDHSASRHIFLGPAAWSLEATGKGGAPGYGVTKSIRYFGQKESWQKEDFWLQ